MVKRRKLQRLIEARDAAIEAAAEEYQLLGAKKHKPHSLERARRVAIDAAEAAVVRAQAQLASRLKDDDSDEEGRRNDDGHDDGQNQGQVCISSLTPHITALVISN